ncbi:hypothetical protein [Alkalihalobacillus trypoxylicola]|uniref:hypothetical protein n=1 Tax=Alkalihalobacillus trypoxylicola TaxID=519424 RepID=UPI0004B1E6E1|nr:hypothetical protein [Alkalihalobacillus trypoxylicola]
MLTAAEIYLIERDLDFLMKMREELTSSTFAFSPILDQQISELYSVLLNNKPFNVG